MGGIARLRGLTVIGLLFGCICGLVVSEGVALGRPSTALRTVRYHGLSVRVPRSWPVFNLARDKTTCLRFDRHALYLGTPGPEERCPAHAVGRTEAILVSPLAASRGAPSATAAGLHLDGDATSFTVPSARVQVTATWSRAPRLVSQALGRKSLPGSTQGATGGSGGGGTGASTNAGDQATRSSARTGVYTGLGFDTCSAPSTRQMAAWYRSPYRGVGIYIGGVNEGCAQPNLSQFWVSHEIRFGWHAIPIYVGLQAPSNACGCAGISPNTGQASSQGQAAASDAVNRAKRLGIPPGNPIYDDMEGYPAGSRNASAVLSFLAGWTSRLHAAGYISGVYSSALSGIKDLISRYGKGYREPDDIWIADWNGRKTTSDPYVPAKDWSNHQRLHQYAGNRSERYGGVRLTVDDDYLNGATANARDGYLLLTSNGGVHRFGPINSYGTDAGHMSPGVSAVALAKDRKTAGYWVLKSNGGVDNFHAPWDGSLKHRLNGLRPVALAESPKGGYLILTSNGGVHPFDAGWHGSDKGHMSPGVSAVGIAVDGATGGYWILKSNGGVDNFKAPWHGSLKHRLGGVGAAGLATAREGGYFILTSDGGVHGFGRAKFYGSDAGKLPAGVTAVSLATSPTITGYRILLSDGGVNSFDTTWYGSLAGRLPAGGRPLSIASAAR